MNKSELYKSEGFKIETEYHGREGRIFYVEKSRLPFDWEMVLEKKWGRGLTIPTKAEWDSYCRRNDADWARKRGKRLSRRLRKF